jgi:hypothetical protein
MIMAKKDDEKKGKKIVESMIEGHKMDSYAEHMTSEMHVCHMCHEVCFKKKPVRQVGNIWICIDCLRELKDVLDQLEHWEEELNFKTDVQRQLDQGLGLDKKEEE